MYQVKESTDVTLVVDTGTQIQQLTLECGQKDKIIAEMKQELTKLVGDTAQIRRDDELGSYLGKAIKDKETQLDNLRSELAIAVVSSKRHNSLFQERERDLREQLLRYEKLGPKPESEIA